MKKRILSLFMSLVMAISLTVVMPAVTVGAATFGDYEYEILDDGTVEITGYTGSASKLTIQSSINGRKVTSIGYKAFRDCESLTGVIIPNSVTSIGGEAFFQCENLKSITIPNSVTSIGVDAFHGTDLFRNQNTEIKYVGNWVVECYGNVKIAEIKSGTVGIASLVFYGDESLTSVTMPKGVKYIGERAFHACSNLTSITIPDSATSIGDEAFHGTKWLENMQKQNSLVIVNGILIDGTTCTSRVTIPNGVTRIGTNAFSKWNYDTKEYESTITSVTIPDSVTSIGESAFGGCKKLRSITIPNSVTSIGAYAFYACTSLTSITIPKSVTSIGSHAFYVTKWLENKQKENPLVIVNGILIDGSTAKDKVTIPNSVTSIGYDAFYCCRNLTSVTIPNSVTSIGDHAFRECTSLRSIMIPDSVISIKDGVFGGCRSLTSITIPNSVTSIGDYAFRNTSLTSVTIPDSVTSIGGSAFEGCENLTSITIPDSVTSTSIGESAFGGCKKLTSITIPNGVTSIGYSAFYACTSLTSVTIPNSVKKIGEEAFFNCSKLTSVTIPNYVKDIGALAFGYYGNLYELKKDDSFEIKCYSGTSGEKYAIDNGFDYELLDEPEHTHKYTSKVTKQPTCTATGVKTFTCSCGDKYTQTIAKTAHKYTTTVVKPTYAAQGYTLHKCSVCGASYKDNYKAKLTLANITKVNFTSSANAVKMSWGKVSGATGYRVYKYDTTKKAWVKQKDITGTSYTFTGLKAGTSYKFTVKPYKKVGSTVYWADKYSTFTASTNPATVNFTLTAGSKKATVKWSKVTGATGYKIYYKTSKNGSWKLLKTTNNKTTSYIKTGLTKGKTYYFTVKAVRTTGGKTYNGAYTTKSVKVK